MKTYAISFITTYSSKNSSRNILPKTRNNYQQILETDQADVKVAGMIFYKFIPWKSFHVHCGTLKCFSFHCCSVHWKGFIINFVNCWNFRIMQCVFRMNMTFSPKSFYIICYFCPQPVRWHTYSLFCSGWKAVLLQSGRLQIWFHQDPPHL